MLNLVELATRVKNGRKSLGLTLDEVSERSGLAKGLLSKVENFRVTPSLPSIIKIAAALDIPLEKLFEGLSLENVATAGVVTKADRKEVERDRECSSIRYYDLAHNRAQRKMDPFELHIPVGGGREKPMQHEGEEFLTVLEGTVNLLLGDENHKLEVGDSIYFNAEVPHCVQNAGETDARILCVFLERV
ncbi:MAG: cupin domain-containing protein [Akkermansiaceae bacterium]